MSPKKWIEATDAIGIVLKADAMAEYMRIVVTRRRNPIEKEKK